MIHGGEGLVHIAMMPDLKNQNIPNLPVIYMVSLEIFIT